MMEAPRASTPPRRPARAPPTSSSAVQPTARRVERSPMRALPLQTAPVPAFNHSAPLQNEEICLPTHSTNALRRELMSPKPNESPQRANRSPVRGSQIQNSPRHHAPNVSRSSICVASSAINESSINVTSFPQVIECVSMPKQLVNTRGRSSLSGAKASLAPHGLHSDMWKDSLRPNLRKDSRLNRKSLSPPRCPWGTFEEDSAGMRSRGPFAPATRSPTRSSRSPERSSEIQIQEELLGPARATQDSVYGRTLMQEAPAVERNHLVRLQPNPPEIPQPQIPKALNDSRASPVGQRVDRSPLRKSGLPSPKELDQSLPQGHTPPSSHLAQHGVPSFSFSKVSPKSEREKMEVCRSSSPFRKSESPISNIRVRREAEMNQNDANVARTSPVRMAVLPIPRLPDLSLPRGHTLCFPHIGAPSVTVLNSGNVNQQSASSVESKTNVSSRSVSPGWDKESEVRLNLHGTFRSISSERKDISQAENIETSASQQEQRTTGEELSVQTLIHRLQAQGDAIKVLRETLEHRSHLGSVKSENDPVRFESKERWSHRIDIKSCNNSPCLESMDLPENPNTRVDAKHLIALDCTADHDASTSQEASQKDIVFAWQSSSKRLAKTEADLTESADAGREHHGLQTTMNAGVTGGNDAITKGDVGATTGDGGGHNTEANCDNLVVFVPAEDGAHSKSKVSETKSDRDDQMPDIKHSVGVQGTRDQIHERKALAQSSHMRNIRKESTQRLVSEDSAVPAQEAKERTPAKPRALSSAHHPMVPLSRVGSAPALPSRPADHFDDPHGLGPGLLYWLQCNGDFGNRRAGTPDMSVFRAPRRPQIRHCTPKMRGQWRI
eukprot:gnl/MRDRNA2_/MRDRNA2_17582_c0_seq1.p1 gnl/MRDRNA2_/MRDRNA2_17582_c0~~gnl/MRDRNA2_/MRDRNA2_17582_c0_seq1.p1  ORF type:complete len:840 (+),score=135.04 gnl/MRDRNA2_/MRDRNA2_17582_c0_seq1:90-2609(+)